MTTTASIHDICPDWCHADHKDGLAEGLDPARVAIHTGAEFGGCVNEIRNYVSGQVFRHGTGGWRLGAIADPSGTTAPRMPTIDLEVYERRHDDDLRYEHLRLHLTSGEARTMARQLERLADLIDL